VSNVPAIGLLEWWTDRLPPASLVLARCGRRCGVCPFVVLHPCGSQHNHHFRIMNHRNTIVLFGLPLFLCQYCSSASAHVPFVIGFPLLVPLISTIVHTYHVFVMRFFFIVSTNDGSHIVVFHKFTQLVGLPVFFIVPVSHVVLHHSLVNCVEFDSCCR